MTPQQQRIVQAEADARAARDRLDRSVSALQDRLSPATLVQEARREFSDARVAARRVAGDPSGKLAAGAAAAVILAFGWPLLRWRRRRRIAARAARIRGD